jgi:hypothetical protein
LKRNPSKIAKSLRRINKNSVNSNGKGWLIHANSRVIYNKLPFGRLNTLVLYYFFSFLSRIQQAAHKRIMRYKIVKLVPHFLSRSYAPPVWFDLAMLEWYVAEVEARLKDFQKKFPNIRCFETTIEGLNSMTGVSRMFEFFNLDYDADVKKVKSILGIKVNTKSEFK